MRLTKIFFGEQLIERFNCTGKRFTKWQIFKFRVKSFFRRLFILCLAILSVFIIVQIARYYFPTIQEVEKQVFVEKEPDYPVLVRIAKCESGNSQFDANGQVILNGNNNGSVDIGKYQINTRLWGKKATELGLNLAVEKDNEAFAIYLYKTLGTEPWVWSKKCWNK